MSRFRPHPETVGPARSRRERGFALLITITLLAFIVLLLLGLAVYTRVETSVAGNTQRQAQARENALLGLNVALGQLQRHAGPDTRVTATAASFGAINGTRHYTGVWSSNATATDTPGTPLTWLVSGNEFTQPDSNPEAAPGSRVPAPLAITPAAPGNRTVDLVGRVTTGSTARTDYVTVPLTEITATGVPGTSASTATTIGRYGWWVGDQGVKAPVAVADTSATVGYAPFDSDDLRQRLRQQIALGAGAADSGGSPLFEPRDTNNASLIANQKILAPTQLAFVRTAANAQLGLARQQQNFHAWSPNNFAVIANTKTGGLKQDLSLAPALLGDAFAAWANYPAYMEKFVPDAPVSDGEGSTPADPVVTAPVIQPAYGADPLRRRYKITPHQLAANGSHQVAPILSYFLLTFNVRTENESVASRPLEARARWMISLWNPYTSSLVPENLRVEITGLPSLVKVVKEDDGTVAEQFSLRTLFGSPLQVNLPWDPKAPAEGGASEDRQSWLPGRVYSWRSVEDTTKGASPPDGGYASAFYSQTLDDSGEGVIRPVGSGVAVEGKDRYLLDVAGSEQIVVTLYAVRPDGDVRIGRFTSPPFLDSFVTSPQEASKSGYQFSYVFRLAESVDTPLAPSTWLTMPGVDLRRRSPPAEIFVVGELGNDPAQYGNSYKKILSPDRLLSRRTDSLSYNEDVPLFELPRGPLLSMGALQHFRIVGQRPFMIGNSWGYSERLNEIPLGELFDRFYFSGLVDGVVPSTTTTGDLILPNPLLKPLRKTDRSRVTIDDVRALMSPPTTTDADGNVIPSVPASSHSSKFFLQGGAFNLNSVNAAAWTAVLRSVRFPAPQSFRYLDVSAESGTAEDTAVATVQSTDAQFFRFSQSAQETYKAEAGAADPSETSPANTHLFRRGMRTLSAAQVAALAGKIVELMGVKHAAADPAGGPYRSLDEFLAPSALFATVDSDGVAGPSRSLLEAAIADAGINADVAEFSSQWLTQADIMTALAPVLFPRSDTFLIRSYGEAVNPVKLPTTYRVGDTVPPEAIEGRAWCEALVQRVPEYFADPANTPPETDPATLGLPTNPDDPTTVLPASQLNAVHGRRFKIISFRWLTRADI